MTQHFGIGPHDGLREVEIPSIVNCRATGIHESKGRNGGKEEAGGDKKVHGLRA